MSLSLTDKQILDEHSGLIHRVVMHCNNPGSVPDLELVLQQADENGWNPLVNIIRGLIMGNHEESAQKCLDHEDSVIIQSILDGLRDPNTLPDLQVNFESTMSAPGIAGLVHATNNHHPQAQQMLISITKQMIQIGGDMAILAERIHPLTTGERDKDKLTDMMSEQGQNLMLEIISELKKLDSQ